MRIGSYELQRPALIAAAPLGAVGSARPAELRAAGVAGVLVSGYDLAVRPGIEVAVALGGPARLTDGLLLVGEAGGRGLLGWTGRAARILRLDDGGITVRNALNGAEQRLTPEGTTAALERLGVDLLTALALPEQVPLDSGRTVRLAPAQVVAWAERAARATARPMLGVVPDGPPGWRQAVAGGLAALPLAGVAVDAANGLEPEARLPEGVRLAYGIENPADLDASLTAGFDLLETDAPRRLALAGRAWTPDGEIDLADERWKETTAPLDPACDCPACQRAVGYLRHLVDAGEMLATLLLLLHNLRTLTRRMEAI